MINKENKHKSFGDKDITTNLKTISYDIGNLRWLTTSGGKLSDKRKVI